MKPHRPEDMTSSLSRSAGSSDREGTPAEGVVPAGGLRGILDSLRRVEGVAAALVVGRDGFVIESLSVTPIDTDAVGAVATSSLAAAEAMGEELKLGTVGSILIEYELGPVAVTPAGPDAILAVVGDQAANLGRVRMEMRKVRQAVAHQL